MRGQATLLGEVLASTCSQDGTMILRGDLNFTLNRWEIQGVSSRVDILVDSFNFQLEFVVLVYVEPISLGPTWRKNKERDASVPKRLDTFLMSNLVLQGVYCYSP